MSRRRAHAAQTMFHKLSFELNRRGNNRHGLDAQFPILRYYDESLQGYRYEEKNVAHLFELWSELGAKKEVSGASLAWKLGFANRDDRNLNKAQNPYVGAQLNITTLSNSTFLLTMTLQTISPAQ